MEYYYWKKMKRTQKSICILNIALQLVHNTSHDDAGGGGGALKLFICSQVFVKKRSISENTRILIIVL
jgi:hypothetical protein